ncbi:DUF6082 family protein [Streptomyces sp. NPDC012466]|uniref:DUF6082 family protein n=1 Tax=Streptomyces sp. NPDC012466 TaxID=3364835 RepID=UPI0036E91FEE
MTSRLKARQWAVWTAVTMVILLLILFTPVLLERALVAHDDWERLSAVSQTYGALSVLFSAAALLGVVASLTYQARQTRTASEEAQRSWHRQLLLVTLEHPEFMVCWEPPTTELTMDRARQLMFTHLIVTSWDAEFRLGRVGEQGVRGLLERHFQGECARMHWAGRSNGWRRYVVAAGDARGIRFVELMDEAYEAALAAGPPVLSAAYFVPAPTG